MQFVIVGMHVNEDEASPGARRFPSSHLELPVHGGVQYCT